MTSHDVSNHILLSYFLPLVNCNGKTNIITNLSDFPTKQNILSLLWKKMDIGYIHSCKTFHICCFPTELLKEMTSYLCSHHVSVSYAIDYWNSLYIDQFVHLKYKTKCECLKYDVFSETRLHIIEKYLSMLLRNNIKKLENNS